MDGLENATQGTRPRTRDISPCVRHTHMRNRTCHATRRTLLSRRCGCFAGIAGNPSATGMADATSMRASRATGEPAKHGGRGDMGGMTEGDGSETSGHISRFGNRHMAEGGRTADMHALRANATDEPVWHNANTGTDGRWRGCSAMMGDIAGRGSRHAANLRRGERRKRKGASGLPRMR